MYPQIVEEAADKYLKVADRLFGIRLEGEIRNDVNAFINDYFFQKFIKGDDVILKDSNEIKYLQSYIVSKLVVYELTEKGFMGTYKEDDTKPGEEIIYLTDAGKQYLNEYFNEDDYEEHTNMEELAEYISGSTFSS
jgi:hypothetical protein